MKSTAMIEISYSEGDNTLGFSVRGSMEWLIEMEAFINYNTAFFIGRGALDVDALVQGRNELIEAFAAMKENHSYQGEIVTLRVAETEPQ